VVQPSLAKRGREDAASFAPHAVALPHSTWVNESLEYGLIGFPRDVLMECKSSRDPLNAAGVVTSLLRRPAAGSSGH
jgi:hypothetical protein